MSGKVKAKTKAKTPHRGSCSNAARVAGENAKTEGVPKVRGRFASTPPRIDVFVVCQDSATILAPQHLRLSSETTLGEFKALWRTRTKVTADWFRDKVLSIGFRQWDLQHTENRDHLVFPVYHPGGDNKINIKIAAPYSNDTFGLVRKHVVDRINDFDAQAFITHADSTNLAMEFLTFQTHAHLLYLIKRRSSLSARQLLLDMPVVDWIESLLVADPCIGMSIQMRRDRQAIVQQKIDDYVHDQDIIGTLAQIPDRLPSVLTKRKGYRIMNRPSKTIVKGWTHVDQGAVQELTEEQEKQEKNKLQAEALTSIQKKTQEAESSAKAVENFLGGAAVQVPTPMPSVPAGFMTEMPTQREDSVYPTTSFEMQKDQMQRPQQYYNI